jgi:hypothetical protein
LTQAHWALSHFTGIVEQWAEERTMENLSRSGQIWETMFDMHGKWLQALLLMNPFVELPNPGH